MRAVVDTNILVSALLTRNSPPSQILRSWSERKFILLFCEIQMRELSVTLRKPYLAARISPAEAGRVVNSLKRFAEYVYALPSVRRSPDPEDDYLLAAAEAGNADYLVTGDKGGLLTLNRHKGTKIVGASAFVSLLS